MIFVINSGSSSFKFKVFDAKSKVLASGIVERVGLDGPFLKAEVAGKEIEEKYPAVADHADALSKVISFLNREGVETDAVQAFGHRVVHGGTVFTKPTLINDKVIAQLKAYYTLAPLHNPPNVMGIEAAMKLAPSVPNVAVFDTAFYGTLPEEAFMYALPYELYQKYGIRKYGFHGISHEYVAHEAAKLLKKPIGKLKLITCHLGSGASVTAVNHGKALDTSMGFTPLEGLMMSTRCGDIDPEIPIWLMRELGMTPDEVDDLMNRKSGTFGISGYKDMRDVIDHAESGEERSKLAVAMFVYDVVRYVGQYMAVMGGCDALVFTAGVGERSKEIRSMIMKRLSTFKLKELVVATDEEGSIARQTAELIGIK